VGTVHSYTVVWRLPTPAFVVPYVVVIVELEGGWHMVSNLVDCPPGDVEVGLAVAVAFVDLSSDRTLPVFRPRGPQSAVALPCRGPS